jgi:hypothetical protein
MCFLKFAIEQKRLILVWFESVIGVLYVCFFIRTEAINTYNITILAQDKNN